MPADMLALAAGVAPYLVTVVAMAIGYLYFCSGQSKVRPHGKGDLVVSSIVVDRRRNQRE